MKPKTKWNYHESWSQTWYEQQLLWRNKWKLGDQKLKLIGLNWTKKNFLFSDDSQFTVTAKVKIPLREAIERRLIKI